MKFLIIFAVLSALALAEVEIEEKFLKAKSLSEIYGENVEVERRIVGGSQVQYGDAPYFAFVYVLNSQNNGYYVTGGTLIKHDWILTNAAAVSTPIIESHVYLGIVGRTSNTLEGLATTAKWYSRAISSSAYRPHPQYNSQNFNNNIGLLKIPLTSSTLQSLQFVSPIQLPRPEDASNNLIGFNGSAYGFGTTEYEAFPLDLYKVNLTVIPNEDCAAVLPQYVNSNVFCTRNDWAISVCAGDEGGPFVGALGGVTRLVGVVSFSVQGCKQGVPATFVRVGNYLNWIDETSNSAASIKLSLILSIAALLIVLFK